MLKLQNICCKCTFNAQYEWSSKTHNTYNASDMEACQNNKYLIVLFIIKYNVSFIIKN